MKGGYKIIDFKNVSLSGTPVTMTDVLVDLLNNYEKVVLLSHVVLSGSAKDDCFSTVLSDGAGGVKLNCYDGYISINSSGAVTYTVASASGMAEDISDLKKTTSLSLASDKCTIDIPNSYSRQNGNVINAFADVIFTENVNSWTKFLNFGYTLNNNMPVMVSIYNYGDTTSHNRRGIAFTNGELSVGYPFINEGHYLIGITFIK